MSKRTKNHEEPVSDFLDEDYRSADNKDELDYWAPLSKLIVESVALRDRKGLSQKDLADAMGTTQSVISRFENMGRVPSYDFIARMAIALGHAPGMTLNGDFMYTVPTEMQDNVSQAAELSGKSTQEFLRKFLKEKLQELELQNSKVINILDFQRDIERSFDPEFSVEGNVGPSVDMVFALEGIAL